MTNRKRKDPWDKVWDYAGSLINPPNGYSDYRGFSALPDGKFSVTESRTMDGKTATSTRIVDTLNEAAGFDVEALARAMNGKQ